MREQAEQLIKRHYRTVEEFCWDKGLNKATVSNFLRGKKDFQLSTLVKLADALGKKLTIRLE
jgi:hypothetical protein